MPTMMLIPLSFIILVGYAFYKYIKNDIENDELDND